MNVRSFRSTTIRRWVATSSRRAWLNRGELARSSSPESRIHTASRSLRLTVQSKPGVGAPLVAKDDSVGGCRDDMSALPIRDQCSEVRACYQPDDQADIRQMPSNRKAYRAGDGARKKSSISMSGP